MIKKLVLLAFVVTLVLSGCSKGDTSNKESTASKEVSSEEASLEDTSSEASKIEETPDGSEIVYNINEYISSFSDAYWDNTDEWFGVRTNREALEIRWKSTIGGFFKGELTMHTLGFTRTVENSKNSYDVTVEDNDFLIVSDIGDEDYVAKFFVMKSDFYFDKVYLSIVELKDSDSYTLNEWVKSDKDYIYIYNIDDLNCIKLKLPYQDLSSDEVEKLATEITAIIGVEKSNKDTSITLAKDSVDLNNNVTLLLNNVKLNRCFGGESDSDEYGWNKLIYSKDRDVIYVEECEATLEELIEYLGDEYQQSTIRYKGYDLCVLTCVTNIQGTDFTTKNIVIEGDNGCVYTFQADDGFEKKNIEEYISFCLDDMVVFK